MFTGIIESLGEITDILKEGENYHFTVEHISYFLLGFGLKSKRKNHQV